MICSRAAIAIVLAAACQVRDAEPLSLEPASPLWRPVARCAAGDLEQCDRALGRPGLRGDPTAALEVARIACVAGRPQACVRAAFELRDVDPVAARALRWRSVSGGAPACGTGDFGCRELVESMRRISFDLIDDDWQRVAALIEPACRPSVGRPEPHSCEILARALDRGCRYGCSDEQRLDALAARASAVAGFEERCATEPIACVRLASLHWWGTGGAPPDRDEARVIVKRSCDGGYQFACLRWARYQTSFRLEATEAERAAGIAELRRLCGDGGSDDFQRSGACHLLSQLYRAGQVVAADPAEAARFAALACDLGYAADCGR